MSSRVANPLFRAATLVAALACGIAAGCAKEEPANDATQPKDWVRNDPAELLKPSTGVVVVDRSGEFSMAGSTISAIDGDPETSWISPPKNLEQWVVFEFPVRTKITQVGASTGDVTVLSQAASKLRFEGSLDGTTFRELGTFEIAKRQSDQIFDVPPTEARFLRVTTLGNHGDPNLVDIPALHAKGEELEQPARPSFAGKWQVFDWTLEIAQDGNALYGLASLNPPMIFYGAVEGRVARLAWTRGMESGLAWFAVNPSSTRLSGTWWHVGPLLDPWFGETWYGERIGNAPEFTVPISKIATVHLQKAGSFPLYGLVFRPDGELDVEASRSAIAFIAEALRTFPTYKVRLEVLDCSTEDEEKNLEISRARGAKLLAVLKRAGFPEERLIIEPTAPTNRRTLIRRLLFTRVDFSLAGS